MRLRSMRLLAGMALVACAGASPGSAGPQNDPNVITLAELQRANAANVYDAIQQIRPSMLRPHLAAQASSISAAQNHTGDYDVHVYLDQNRIGDLTTLEGIPVSTVREVRYLDPAKAMQQFGSGNPGGVILLLSR
jgi:hypothetical protein